MVLACVVLLLYQICRKVISSHTCRLQMLLLWGLPNLVGCIWKVHWQRLLGVVWYIYYHCCLFTCIPGLELLPIHNCLPLWTMCMALMCLGTLVLVHDKVYILAFQMLTGISPFIWIFGLYLSVCWVGMQCLKIVVWIFDSSWLI